LGVYWADELIRRQSTKRVTKVEASEMAKSIARALKSEFGQD
jgi:hypothetical protein